MSTDQRFNEFAGAVTAWSEVLYGFVPADKLEESFLAAMRGRKSTFPLGVSEICAAYSASEEYRGPVEQVVDPVQRDCQDCWGTGMVVRTEDGVRFGINCKHDGTTPREDSV